MHRPIKVRWRGAGKARSGKLRARSCKIAVRTGQPAARVSYFLDGTRIGTTRYPSRCKFSARKATKGKHVLKVVVTDLEGHRAAATIPGWVSRDLAKTAKRKTKAPAPSTSTTTPDTTASTSTSTSTSTTPAGWTLVKEWTFDSFNASEWNIYNGFKTSGNTVGGIYKSSNVRVANGELQLVGDGINGAGLNTNLPRTYGRWEIRARMDAGAGAGPCLLLWPQSDRWPEDGEIDIMESADAGHREVAVTNHWGTWPSISYDQKKIAMDATQWHTYAVEWESGTIRYYIDGALVHSRTGTPGADIPNKAMSLAMQVDGPNGWIPKRDSQSPAEMVLHIDNVRALSR